MNANASHPTTCLSCTPVYGNYVRLMRNLNKPPLAYTAWLSAGMPGPHNVPHFIAR